MSNTTQAAKDAATIQSLEEQRAKNRYFLTLATRDHKSAAETLAEAQNAVRLGDYSQEERLTDAKFAEAEASTSLNRLQDEDERLMHALAPLVRRGVVAERLALAHQLGVDAQDVILRALADGQSEAEAEQLAKSIAAERSRAQASASPASYQRATDVILS